MQANWRACLAIILREEGGSDDDKDDPGGRTSRGITQKEWNAFRRTNPNSPSDVWDASQTEINTIYLNNYWNPYCDDLPSGEDLVFFNTSVNSGRTQAVKELQRAVGIKADGTMGLLTWDAVKEADIEDIIRKQCDERRAFYQHLKTFWKYGKGWLARTDRVEVAALALAAKASPSVVEEEHPTVDTKPSDPTTTVSPKAPTSSADTPSVSPETSGGVATGGGVILAAFSQIKDISQPLNGTKYAEYALLAMTVVAAITAVWGLIKRNNVAKAIG